MELDAAIGSGKDASEAFTPGDLTPEPRLSVWTAGDAGGRWRTADGEEGTYAPAALAGPIADAYGCGDCFAAGTTFGLARGDSIPDALALGSRCGADALVREGPYGERA